MIPQFLLKQMLLCLLKTHQSIRLVSGRIFRHFLTDVTHGVFALPVVDSGQYGVPVNFYKDQVSSSFSVDGTTWAILPSHVKESDPPLTLLRVKWFFLPLTSFWQELTTADLNTSRKLQVRTHFDPAVNPFQLDPFQTLSHPFNLLKFHLPALQRQNVHHLPDIFHLQTGASVKR